MSRRHRRRDRFTVAVLVGVFLAGLACRMVIVARVPQEGDELIYRALVEQLDAGKGYTLRGHEILKQDFIVPEQYGRELFYHPPGGPLFFWLMHRLTGGGGLAMAQIASYALFYWSLVALAGRVLGPPSRVQAVAIAGLAAFTPIMTHVTSRYWLDGPLLAFSTAAAAMFFSAVARRSRARAAAAGVLLGAASLVKLTAFLIVPGWLLLGWAVFRDERRAASVFGLIALVVAAVTQSTWEIWQWHTLGSLFPSLAGKPSPDLVATNPYIHHVTVVRTPWTYLRLLPGALWTLVPSLLLLAFQAAAPRVRRRGLALVGWMAVVVLFHMALGSLGYSKLLRYVVLVTPASVLLFGLVVPAAWERLREGSPLPGGRAVTWALLVLAGLGFLSEIVQGIWTPLFDYADLIWPVWWRIGML